MRCETYSRWMTGAAAGALSAPQQRELRAHASACQACHSDWTAAHALAAAIDRSMAAIVSGEPSPRFVARLEARIAAEPAPAPWPGLVHFAFVGAALAATVLLAVMYSRTSRPSALPGAEQAVAARSAAPQIEPSAAPVATVAPPTGSVARVSAHPRHAPQRNTLDFQVLVPRGQWAAALDLSEAINAGRVDGTQLAALAEQSALPLEWKDIEIVPLAGSPAEEAQEPASPDGANRF